MSKLRLSFLLIPTTTVMSSDAGRRCSALATEPAATEKSLNPTGCHKQQRRSRIIIITFDD
jgi:hypothetical protein